MKLLMFGTLMLLAATIAFAEDAAPLHVGSVAPTFSLPYATRDSIASDPLTLAGMVGKGPVILAFYPADWSGGCTAEVCALRDNFSALGALNAQVVGISGDYVFSHYEWAKHHDLPFRLASDHKHEVAKLYGSYNEASGHDRRTVFAVDAQGKLAYIDMAYSPRDSVSFTKLKSALAAMK